jgi:hypothetical protein
MKWLVETPGHLDMRAREFSQNGKLSKLVTKHKTDEQAYEDKVYHGPYSQVVRANAAIRNEMTRIQKAGGNRAEARKTLCATMPHLAKRRGGLMQEPEPEKLVKKADRHAAPPCVKLLQDLQKDLKNSDWLARLAEEKMVTKRAKERKAMMNPLAEPPNVDSEDSPRKDRAGDSNPLNMSFNFSLKAALLPTP